MSDGENVAVIVEEPAPRIVAVVPEMVATLIVPEEKLQLPANEPETVGAVNENVDPP